MRTILALLALFPAGAAAAEVDFSHDVAPLLKEHCGKCHAGSQKKGGLSINSRQSLLAGGDSGPAIVVGQSRKSELYQRITSRDDTLRMPPEGPPLTDAQVALLARWIDSGLAWEPGITFGPHAFEPPLKPRMPKLPPAAPGREHPLDRILDAYLAREGRQPPPPLDDAAFLRRASLDLVGLLPTPAERDAFQNDPRPDKRARLIRALLERDVDYAEHWLTFWNDLLRNDYAGTGFITNGRKQISRWLYHALVTNKPYDQFVRELIAPPTPDSAGFADGIRWRGVVSAGQTVEIQFAQSVGQAFLGINLKCASCHDSFIDRWTLDDAYGLAAIYSQRPLEQHRCDKPLGKAAQPAWLFPELGQVDPAAPQPERLQQLAALLTHRDNGRFTRTIVNRLWHRLMGYGIVHPPDAMQTEPWNSDLLDFLAEHLAASGYDLKKTLELIATSQAYQSRAERVASDADVHGYHYAGPRSKRLTAEQFLDAVWQITGTAPRKFDAPVVRGKPDPAAAATAPVTGVWIWSTPDAARIPAGQKIVFRRELSLPDPTPQVVAAIACDNEYTLYLNGKQVHAGDNWLAPDLVALAPVQAGANELLIVAKNAGTDPNPAGLFFEARWRDDSGTTQTLVTDSTWQWTKTLPNAAGRFRQPPDDWQPAAAVRGPERWTQRVADQLARLLSQGDSGAHLMVRASLLKSDFLMRSLGRPNRDQIVSVRPLELTTLEAIDLANGEALASLLRHGAAELRVRGWRSPDDFVSWLYRFAIGREPTPEELATLSEAIGPELSAAAIEDVLWTVLMLPEFQFVH